MQNPLLKRRGFKCFRKILYKVVEDTTFSEKSSTKTVYRILSECLNPLRCCRGFFQNVPILYDAAEDSVKKSYSSTLIPLRFTLIIYIKPQ